jgi:hypothetical protein
MSRERIDWTLKDVEDRFGDSEPKGACLPSQLDERWLGRISLAAGIALTEEDHPDDEVAFATVLLMVVRLLMDKSGGATVEVSQDELFEYVKAYHVEIALEEVSRNTSIVANAATVENIFTNRRVIVQRTDGGGAR